MQNKSLPRYAFSGIFVLCFGLLYYELFFVRILAFVGGAHSIYLTIAFAMLGLAAASSVVSVIPSHSRLMTSRATIPVLTGLVGWMALLSLHAASLIKQRINAIELEAIKTDGFMGLVSISHDTSFISICVLGVAASLAYFFFGAVISFLFRACREQDFGRLYAWDLFGACAGCIGVVVAMEMLSFTWVASFCVVVPSLAAVIFALGAGRSTFLKRAMLCNVALSIVAVWLSGSGLEPKPLLQRLARDYGNNIQNEQYWHVWNSYGRISGVLTEKGGKPMEVIVHGNGEGHADVPSEINGDVSTSVKFSTIGEHSPKRVLVLLAGAGLDMQQFQGFLGDDTEIVGVELIGDVFEQPYDRDMGTTRRLLDAPNVTMVRAEAREFLAREQGYYDTILVSWSGASLSYFSGAASSAADFIYTKEAMAALLGRLSAHGQLILLNGNKIRHIFALKEIFQESEFEAPFEKSLVVVNAKGADHLGVWWQAWDSQRLLVKPSGYTPEEIADLSGFQKILYNPLEEVLEPSNWYQAAVVTDSRAVQQVIEEEYAVNLSVVTDDKPFILDTFPFGYYFSSVFWGEDSGIPLWRIKKRHLQFVLIFAICSAVLILTPLAFNRRKTDLARGDRWLFLLYFSGIGAGFMFCEIALISKLQLLIGHPGYVIAIVLASVILFTGLGSLTLDSNLRRIGQSTPMIAIGVVLMMGLTVFLFELLEPMLIAWSFEMKCLVAFVVPAVPCYLMGHLFPLGLKRLSSIDSQLTPWALAVNGVSGTLASGMTLILAQAFGYNAMVVFGCIGYLVSAVCLSRLENRSAASSAS